ncbi:MAG: hypothetical protein K0R68_1657 [Mycobacterium sp.]|nr:hypothetical protein [Mycobacterium sp.]
MTFTPVGSWVLLLVIGLVLVILRGLALYRISARRGRRRVALLRWAGLTAAVLLILGAAARPGVDTNEEVTAVAAGATSEVNVFLVMDRSAGSPVAQMRPDLTALIDEYPDARFGLISFATRATVDWPLSDDVWSLRSLVSGLAPYVAATPDPVAQTNAFAARDVLRAKVDAATAQYPGSQNLVFYLGTGDPGSLVSRGTFDLAPGSVAGGAVLGYGEADGTDAARLAEIAAQLDVPLRGPGTPVAEIAPEPAAGSADALQVGDRREFYWLLTLLAAVLLLAEVGLTLREYHKNRLSRQDLRL